MPRIITTTEQFEKLTENATECRIIRSEKSVKLKLRTPKYLYTYIANPDEADDIIKGLKDIEIVEFGAKRKESKEDSKKGKEKKAKTAEKEEPEEGEESSS